MNKAFLVQAVKENWYLVAALVAMPVVGLIVALQPEKADDDIQAATVEVTMSDEEAATLRANAQQSVPWARTNRSDQDVDEAIDTYKAQVNRDINSDESAEALANMANLYYSKRGDWENAALYYEILLDKHPDYSANKVSYANLASCYERLKVWDLARTAYERMRDHFGPGTKEYDWAIYKLDNPSTLGQ